MNFLWLVLAVPTALLSMFLFAVVVFWTDQADRTARPSEVKANVRG